jgi:hypothetical protein
LAHSTSTYFREEITMKRIVVLTTCIILTWLTSGCSAIRLGSGGTTQTYTTTDGKNLTATDTEQAAGVYFTQSPEILVPRMRAERELIDARSREALVKNALTAQQTKPEQNLKRLGIVNNGDHHDLYFFHPLYPGMKIDVRARGGFGWVDVPASLKEITIYVPGTTPGRKRESLKAVKGEAIFINGMYLNYYMVYD